MAWEDDEVVTTVDRVEVLRRLRLVLILDRERRGIGVDTDRLIVVISDSDDRGHHALGLLLYLRVALTITLQLLPLIVLCAPRIEIGVDVHLTARNELDVLSSLPELISVKPRVTETVHLTVIGE